MSDPDVGLLRMAGHASRQAALVLHGPRAAEVVDLRWEQVDFKNASLHVRRVKNGTPSTNPLTGRELRELRRHQRESPKSPFVFVSERGAPFSAPGFSRMIERGGDAAKLGIKAHAHMLRHVNRLCVVALSANRRRSRLR
jgi:integrase